jgi:D-alanine transfer protein
LSLELKQHAARRLLSFPDTLQGDEVLRFGVQRLADASPIDRAMYYAILPLGKLENVLLGLQDHWETLAYVGRQAGSMPSGPRDARSPDWSRLLAQIDREVGRRADSNPFGFYNEIWEVNGSKLTEQRNTHSDEEFIRSVQGAIEWTDFDLLLRGLVELGAQPMVLSMPINGTFYEYTGVSALARSAYY